MEEFCCPFLPSRIYPPFSTPRAGAPCQSHVIMVESRRANHARANHDSKTRVYTLY